MCIIEVLKLKRVNTRYFCNQKSILVGSELKVKSNYFIVRPKVDQRDGILSLPHLKIFAIHTR